MAHELAILGDPEEPRKAVSKYLHVVPKRFVPIAFSIESLLDTTTMSIGEIIGLLRVIEGHGDDEDVNPPTGVGGKLPLIEEQWLARMKEKQAAGEGNSKPGSDKGGSKNQP
jgi:hypothetical protein